MAWTSLADRYNKLPLVIAGPILRKVTASSVTVWVAMSGSCDSIFLEIYESDDKSGGLIGTDLGIPLKIGGHLYVSTITVSGLSLEKDKIYFYDILFNYNDHLEEAEEMYLDTPGTLTSWESGDRGISLITYGSYNLPSFLLPASDIESLKIVHGSCRKPHGGQRADGDSQTPEYFLNQESGGLDIDALSYLDTILTSYAGDITRRPQLLFLTGDQIYSDDVADLMLCMLVDARKILVDIDSESIDTADSFTESLPIVGEESLDPLTRYDDINDESKGYMSSGEYAKCHLMRLSEFYCMYLFAWSDILWNNEVGYELPGYDKFYEYWRIRDAENTSRKATETKEELEKNTFDLPLDKTYTYYKNERKALRKFKSTLPKIRKALANIATYMMFDDHEITDDWFLDLDWCNHVLTESPLGKRVVQNGLSAYAVFQGWGNTPERFADTSSKEYQILIYLQDLNAAKYSAEIFSGIEETIMPEIVLSTPSTIEYMYLSGGPDWFFYLDFDYFQVIVLNSRTNRGFNPEGHVRLLSTESFSRQLAQASSDNSKYRFTLLIAPAPVFGHPNLELVQGWVGKGGYEKETEWDYEPWTADEDTWNALLFALLPFKNVVMLSGDVHYGFSAQADIQYNIIYDNDAETDPKPVLSYEKANILQLTSSAIKNSEKKISDYVLMKKPPLGLQAMSIYFLDPELYKMSITDPVEYSAWDTDGIKGSYTFLVEIDTDETVELTISLNVNANQFKLTQNNFNINRTFALSTLPDTKMSLEFKRDTRSPESRGDLVYEEDLNPAKDGIAEKAKKVTGIHSLYTSLLGMEVAVGMNNIGYISFERISPVTSETGEINDSGVTVKHCFWYTPISLAETGEWTIHELTIQ